MKTNELKKGDRGTGRVPARRDYMGRKCGTPPGWCYCMGGPRCKAAGKAVA